MKGVILAGGAGTRLHPLTKVTNKHLLPIYDEPMIYYPIKTLKAAGITDMLIVVGGESIGDFLKLLGSGKELGVKITYKCQVGAEGIPAALALAEEFVGDDRFMMVLGDNVMQDSLKEEAARFSREKAEAHIFLKEVSDPERYGVAEVRGNKIVSLAEKPEKPASSLAITGVYMFASSVFSIIPTLKPSKRGELEIVDVLKSYIGKKKLTYSLIPGFWTDAGTLEALYHANTLVRENRLK